MIHRYKQAEDITDDYVRTHALLFVFTLVNKASLNTWLDWGIPGPDDCYIFAQPWITLTTSMGVFSAPGVGSTAYNYNDAVLYFNGVHKLWEIHFTAWYGCSFQIQDGYYMVPDVKFEKYNSSMDDNVFTDPDDFNPEAIDFRYSGFIFSCGSSFTRNHVLQFANPLPLYGKYDNKSLPYNIHNKTALLDNNVPLYPSFLYYAYIWQFANMAHYLNVDTSTYMAEKEQKSITGMMFPMRTRKRNHTNGEWVLDYRGDGHLAEMNPPCLPRFSGKITTIVDKKL